MSSSRVIGVGAGGHAKVLIELVRATEKYEIVGLLDRDKRLWNLEVLGVPVLGDDDLFADLLAAGIRYAFVGVGGTGDNEPRKKEYGSLIEAGFELAQTIHPVSSVSVNSKLGSGVMIASGAIVGPSTHIGNNVIVNTGAIVEHGCTIDDHVHIAPGSVLAGGVAVGCGTHIGAGAIVMEGLTIGRMTIIGAGAVVTRDVPDGVVAVGTPARILREVSVP
jgi:sugar O-acyltransferase (sialic acid O-acetyltransferase NeuD family)